METQQALDKLSGAIANLTDLQGEIDRLAHEFGDGSIESNLDNLQDLVIDLKDELDNYQAEQEETP